MTSASRLLFPALYLILALGCQHEEAGPDAEDCNRILKEGLQDSLQVSNNKALSEHLRKSFDDFLNEHQEFKRSDNTGLNVGIGGITIGGSNDYNSQQLADLLWKLHDDQSYVLNENEAFSLSLKVANRDVVDAWSRCMDHAHVQPRIRLTSTQTGDTVVIRPRIPGNGEVARILSVTVRGGKFDGTPPRVGSDLRDGDEFFVRRSGNSELLFALRTTKGTASVLLEGSQPPTPPRAHHTRTEVVPPGNPVELPETVGRNGGDPYSISAAYPERITQIEVWHWDYVDGILLSTAKGALPRIGGTGKDNHITHEVVKLDADEYITAVYVEGDKYIDRMTITTNKRRLPAWGGNGGGIKKTMTAPPGKQIVGFHGRAADFVDQLGIVVQDIPTTKVIPID